jgi:hypothetical protein
MAALTATLAIGGIGCGGTDAATFGGYGQGHPGAGLNHGGQIFLEKVHRPDEWTGDQGWLNGYQRSYNDTNIAMVDTLPLPPIPPGECMDISTNVFPRQFGSSSGAGGDGDVTYGDLGATLTLTPTDSSAPTLSAPKVEGFVDNLQYRVELGYQNSPFNAEDIRNDTYYDISFDGSENLTPNQIYMPPAYEIYSPAVGKEELVFNRGEDLVINWDPVNQDVGGAEHTAERTFANVIFVGFPDMEAGTQFKVVCPINDGAGHDTFSIPASVMDSLPPAGIMITGQPTHMMAALNGERFDLIAIECNQSRFSFAE